MLELFGDGIHDDTSAVRSIVGGEPWLRIREECDDGSVRVRTFVGQDGTIKLPTGNFLTPIQVSAHRSPTIELMKALTARCGPVLVRTWDLPLGVEPLAP